VGLVEFVSTLIGYMDRFIEACQRIIKAALKLTADSDLPVDCGELRAGGEFRGPDVDPSALLPVGRPHRFPSLGAQALESLRTQLPNPGADGLQFFRAVHGGIIAELPATQQAIPDATSFKIADSRLKIARPLEPNSNARGYAASFQ